MHVHVQVQVQTHVWTKCRKILLRARWSREDNVRDDRTYLVLLRAVACLFVSRRRRYPPSWLVIRAEPNSGPPPTPTSRALRYYWMPPVAGSTCVGGARTCACVCVRARSASITPDIVCFALFQQLNRFAYCVCVCRSLARSLAHLARLSEFTYFLRGLFSFSL